MDGPPADALESKDTGDLGKRRSGVWSNEVVGKLDVLDVSNVTRPSSFCSSCATRLKRNSVVPDNGSSGLGTYVGFEVRVRLRLGLSVKKQCFFKR